MQDTKEKRVASMPGSPILIDARGERAELYELGISRACGL